MKVRRFNPRQFALRLWWLIDVLGEPSLRQRDVVVSHSTTKEIVMTLTAAHISPIIALIAGILILIVPSLLNYVVAIYLIVIGLIGLNGIYHFIH